MRKEEDMRNIQKLNNGKYMVTFYAGKGAKHRKTFTDYWEGLKARNKFEYEYQNMNVTPSGDTFAQYAAKFLDVHVADENTIYGYRNILKHIETARLAKIKLYDLKAFDIREYIKYITEVPNPRAKDGHLSPRSVNKHLHFIHLVLERAVEDEIIPNNVAGIVKPIKLRTKFRPDIYDVDEIKTVEDLVNSQPDYRIKLIFHFGAFSGLRRSEICGLSWKDIDLNKGYLYINKRRVQIGKEVLTGEPKSASSNRPILISNYVRNLLVDINNTYNYAGTDTPLIFMPDGSQIRPTYVSELWKKFCDSNKIKYVTVHGLRHSCATNALYLGANILEVGMFLGHASTETTEKYLHAREKAADAAVIKLDAGMKEQEADETEDDWDSTK